MHPWEDWAETWAHYLHMIDTLETASTTGISVEPPRIDEPTLKSVPNPVEGDVGFDVMMTSWTTITYILNNLNRGLGNDDAYPFRALGYVEEETPVHPRHDPGAVYEVFALVAA